MRRVALLAALLAVAVAGPAEAQRADERHSLRPGEKLIERDALGRRMSTFQRESTGKVIERDPQGRRVRTFERSGDRIIKRDAQGRRTGTIERGR